MLIFYVFAINGQHVPDESNQEFFESNGVHWIGQVPGDMDGKKRKKGWFKNIILGKDDLSSLQKPMQMLPSGLDDGIILDQGNGTIFYDGDKGLEVPRFIRKRDELFPSLVSACSMPDGKVLFTDSRLGKIYVLDKKRKSISALNESYDLMQPTGIAYDKQSKRIWVVETGAHKISILDLDGNRIKAFGGRGLGEGEFNYPNYLWIDNEGLAYVVDALNYRVQIFDQNGTFQSMFGENGNGTGFISSPKGIATDSYGHIYLVDALFHGVQVFDRQGNYLHQFGTQGRHRGEFWMPSGIFIDENDIIYVSDSYNKRVQKFELIFRE